MFGVMFRIAILLAAQAVLDRPPEVWEAGPSGWEQQAVEESAQDIMYRWEEAK